MPEAKYIDIKDLFLDLKNPRTVPQESEEKAIETMISIKPDRFNAVMESILDDGYLTTESVIVLNDGHYVVKEGNRRIAILKIIHGIYDKKTYAIPSNIQERIDSLTPEWLANNRKIPCGVYSIEETDLADKIVNLTHAKGEKASRDPWTSVAKARHNRDIKKGTELGLDLLEKYLKDGKNINQSQKERWSGDYPITVLDEALRKIFERLNFVSVSDLVASYPKIEHRLALEEILLDIGQERTGYKQIRDKDADFLLPYGIFAKEELPKEGNPLTENPTTDKEGSFTGEIHAPKQPNSTSPTRGESTTPKDENPEAPNPPTIPTLSPPEKPKSTQLGTPKYVKGILRKFNPKGNRQKVVAIKAEMLELAIDKTPMAFCFLLRSAFEISAKEYCKDNGIDTEKTSKKRTQNKILAELLREIVNHLTDSGKNKGMEKELHGALTEITKSEGILSVTSMNQLVHGTTFSIPPSDICIIFGNIYPLLEAMN